MGQRSSRFPDSSGIDKSEKAKKYLNKRKNKHFLLDKKEEVTLGSARSPSHLRSPTETEESKEFECSGRTAGLEASLQGLSTIRGFTDSLERSIFRHGLQNLGNTDFINAALNGLYSLRSFRSYFTSQQAQSPLMNALIQFCITHTREQVQSDVLYQFKSAIPEFNDGRQHCANSYVFKLLMRLDTLMAFTSDTSFSGHIFENKLVHYRSGKCQPLHDAFAALVENLFICEVCYNTIRNFSYFRTVDVPIPHRAQKVRELTVFNENNFYPGEFTSNYIGPGSEDIYTEGFSQILHNLYDFERKYPTQRTDLPLCFEYMLRASLMSSENKMPCSRCGLDTQHYKQSFFRQLSTALVIHFQRLDEFTGQKLNTPVYFPMKLDMSKYCTNDRRKYVLRGVVYHMGDLDFGHYTACINVDGRWYNVDDSFVREEQNLPPIEDAYMLFYEEETNHDICCKVDLIKARSQLTKVGKIRTKSLTFDAFLRLKALKSRRFTEGLKNLGNTCFMNAALNGLFSFQAFRAYFATTVSTSCKHPLVLALATFCNEYMQGGIQEAVLKELIMIPSFCAEKMDCSNRYVRELLIHLDTLLVFQSQTRLSNSVFEGRLKQYRSGKCEPLHDISSALIENLFICPKCGNIQQKFSYSRTIDVPVPYRCMPVTFFGENDFYSHLFSTDYTGTKESESVYQNRFKQVLKKSSAGSSPRGHQTPIELSLCFKYMLRASLMSLENKTPCSKCREDIQHYKHSFFRHLSTALIIHFQRFDESTKQKLDTLIAFPMELDMSEYCANDPRQYVLRGVVYHTGDLGSGHYTACINVKGRWYNVNDLDVREVHDRPPIENAYMLFYEEITSPHS